MEDKKKYLRFCLAMDLGLSSIELCFKKVMLVNFSMSEPLDFDLSIPKQNRPLSKSSQFKDQPEQMSLFSIIIKINDHFSDGKQ